MKGQSIADHSLGTIVAQLSYVPHNTDVEEGTTRDAGCHQLTSTRQSQCCSKLHTKLSTNADFERLFYMLKPLQKPQISTRSFALDI